MSSLHIVQRLIPTHAGKTDLLGSVRKYLPGSSPLTRGKQSGITQILDNTGSIPDHAGKTHPRCNSSNPARAHPRSRGENGLHSIPIVRALGSSPRGRGKLRTSPRVHAGGGLIPAHAGKTHPRCNSSNPARAHPRSRGENGLHSIPIVRALGSSPRGRGKLRTSPRVHAGGGLIPARAGKTASPGTTCGLTWAYPRSRGENRRSGQEARFETGSSPRGRGKRGCDSGGRGHRGLIPTRAGKTPGWRPARGRRWAHPHAGGENNRRACTWCSS